MPAVRTKQRQHSEDKEGDPIEGQICAFICDGQEANAFLPISAEWGVRVFLPTLLGIWADLGQEMMRRLADEFKVEANDIRLSIRVGDNDETTTRPFRISKASWPRVLQHLMAGVLSPPFRALSVDVPPKPVTSAVAAPMPGPSNDVLSVPKSSASFPGTYPQTQIDSDGTSCHIADVVLHRAKNGKIQLKMIDTDGSNRMAAVRPEFMVMRLKRIYARHQGRDARSFNLGWRGCRLDDYKTFAEAGVEDGDEIYTYPVQCGGKPVIYLYPPQPTKVTVKLALHPEWSFSALYPPTQAKMSSPDLWESVEWSVEARPDGSLLDIETGLDLSYLYWEDRTNAPSREFVESTGIFQPARPVLDTTDPSAIALPADKVAMYLDKALRRLGLQVEARNSFITYWLPSILKHKYVALRFLPQTVYEPACPLDITPEPDVMTRVFMLFRGIDSLDPWEEANKRAMDGIIDWRAVVGVADEARQNDTQLFRVLEWGGMEIKQ